MSDDPLKGYKGRARAKLGEWGVRVWSDVVAKNDAGSEFEGVILPRSETLDDEHIVIKLRTGYNVGLHIDRIREVREVGYKEAVYKIPERAFPSRPDLPKVTLLGTGGTIASRLDYRTGAVIPAFSPGELYGSVPELADICNLETEKLFGVFSENMGPEQYLVLAGIGQQLAYLSGASGKGDPVREHAELTAAHRQPVRQALAPGVAHPLQCGGIDQRMLRQARGRHLGQHAVQRRLGQAGARPQHALYKLPGGGLYRVTVTVIAPTIPTTHRACSLSVLHAGPFTGPRSLPRVEPWCC